MIFMTEEKLFPSLTLMMFISCLLSLLRILKTGNFKYVEHLAYCQPQTPKGALSDWTELNTIPAAEFQGHELNQPQNPKRALNKVTLTDCYVISV
jgi:hypothetical protein